jgi:hypothetical protein
MNEDASMLATIVRIRAALFIDIPPLNINITVSNKLEISVLPGLLGRIRDSRVTVGMR